MRIKEKFDNKLLVEGADDQHVVWAICQQFQVKETFDVIDLEGIDNLIEDILVRPRQADLSCLGIIVDADTNIQKRWDQLRSQLGKSGYNLPDLPTPPGTIITIDRLPKIGIWVMPDNQNPGMLEDFVRHLIAPDDACLPFAEETLQKLEIKGFERYNKATHRSKALIHTWLAWQEDPGTPLGWAITRYLNIDTDLCQQFVAWLNRLFNEA